MKPLHVLHVVTGLKTGGAERMLVRLVRALRDRTEQAVLALSGGPMRAELDRLGVPVLQLATEGKLGVLLRIPEAVKFARTFRPDVIQGWMYHGNLAAHALRNVLGDPAPCVWGVRQTLYDIRSEKPLTRLVIRACAAISGKADGILYNSRVASDQHRAFGFTAARSELIPNGLEAAEFEPIDSAPALLRERLQVPRSALLVGSVARFHPMKDHRSFLSAAARLAPRFPQAHFVLAGRNVEAREAGLEEHAIRLGVRDRVHFLGEISQPELVIGGLDLLCSSSAWGEGFPNVLGEALARGVPCVATDVGDSRDVVGAGGRIVPARDPEALADAIGALLAMSTAERRSIGLLGRQHVHQNFGMDAVVRRYEDFYRSVLPRAAAPGA